MGRVWAEEDEERGADRMRNNVTRLDLHNTEEANDGNDIQRRKKILMLIGLAFIQDNYYFRTQQ